MNATALSWSAHARRAPLLLFLVLYTVLTGGPFLWVAIMSVRTTPEIFANPYALPSRFHWEKFVDAWTNSNYGTYFWNSTIVVVSAVALLTIIGAMVAHCLARYRFRGNRLVRFIILSGMILPPQLLILSLFQILLDYHLYNTLSGLVIVYVAGHLAMTVYILEGFFAQIPQDLFDAARKKPIPMLPQRIAVVTSPHGAAIRDVLNVLARRYAGQIGRAHV